MTIDLLIIPIYEGMKDFKKMNIINVEGLYIFSSFDINISDFMIFSLNIYNILCILFRRKNKGL